MKSAHGKKRARNSNSNSATVTLSSTRSNSTSRTNSNSSANSNFTSNLRDNTDWITGRNWRTEARAGSRAFRNVRLTNRLTRDDLYRHLRKELSSLTNNDVRALADGIDYKNARGVEAALRAAGAWLRGKVGTRKYMLVVDDNPFEPKSTMWLAHKAIDAIGRWPTFVTTQEDVVATLKPREDVRTLVYFDDASYSGTQITTFLLKLRDASNSRNMATRGLRVFVAVGFASKDAQEGVEEVMDWLRRRGMHCEFYAHRGMRMTSNFLDSLPPNQRGRLARVVGSKDDIRTFAIMAHKIPNALSFPAALSHALTKNNGLDTLMRPPYKNVDLRVQSPQYIYDKNGLRFYVLKHPLHKYVHVAHVFKNGQLVSVPEKSFGSPYLRPPPRTGPRTKRRTL